MAFLVCGVRVLRAAKGSISEVGVIATLRWCGSLSSVGRGDMRALITLSAVVIPHTRTLAAVITVESVTGPSVAFAVAGALILITSGISLCKRARLGVSTRGTLFRICGFEGHAGIFVQGVT